MAELVDVSKNAAAAVAAAEKDGASAGELQELQTAAASALSAIETAAAEEAEAARFRSVELGGGGEIKAKAPTPEAPLPVMSKFGMFMEMANPKNIIKNFKVVYPKIKKGFTNMFKKVGKFFTSIIEKIKNKFGDIPAKIKEKFSGIKDSIVEKFTGAFEAVKSKVKNIFSGVSDFFNFSGIADSLIGVFKKAKNKIISIFSTVGSAISGVFKTPINAIIDMINNLIKNVNDAFTFEIFNPIPGSDNFKLESNIPTIPALAKGGITTTPTLAMIGEAGPEAIIPLDKLSSIIPQDNSKSSNEPLPQSNDELKKELQELKAIMTGFVNQMAQVVDRPITVELDGNKVGQALGQNSYRMQ